MQEIFNNIIKLKSKHDSKLVFDTRNIKRNDIFIGIGEGNKNGGLHFKDALDRGAALLLINNSKASHKKIIQIKNIQNFIDKFCKFLLNKYSGKIISITGSVGKTTIKENIYQVLLKNNYRTYKSYKNYNNKLGLQFSIMNMKMNDNFSIFELGINSPGEMQGLINILNPHYSLITCIENSHIGNFKNFNDLVNNKLKIFKSKNLIKGLVNYRHSKPNIIKKIDSKISYVNLDIIKRNVTKKDNYQIEFNFNKKKYKIISDFDGIYEEIAILTHIFLNQILKIKLDSKLLFKESILQSRGKIISRKYKDKTIKIYDHSYNSSPYSLEKQLLSFEKRKLNKKLCIIGSMKELGKKSNNYHKEIINLVNELNFDKTIFIGNEFYKFTNVYKNLKFYKTTNNYIKYMKKDLLYLNNVFIMGSRFYKLDRIINEIC